MTRRVVLLTPIEEFVDLARQVREIDANCEIQYAENEKQLRERVQNFQSHDRLIAYLSSVVIPSDLLEDLPTPAFNFHSGPPEFPGVFPAFYALYNGAKNFGVTVHEITADVNQGPIVGVETSAIAPTIQRSQLEGLGRQLLARLLKRMLPPILDKVLKPACMDDVQWSDYVPRLADYKRLAMIPHDIDEAELERRVRAFGPEGLKKLHTTIHGRRFGLEPKD